MDSGSTENLSKDFSLKAREIMVWHLKRGSRTERVYFPLKMKARWYIYEEVLRLNTQTHIKDAEKSKERAALAWSEPHLYSGERKGDIAEKRKDRCFIHTERRKGRWDKNTCGSMDRLAVAIVEILFRLLFNHSVKQRMKSLAKNRDRGRSVGDLRGEEKVRPSRREKKS